MPCKQGVSGSIPLISIDIRNTYFYYIVCISNVYGTMYVLEYVYSINKILRMMINNRI